MKKLNSDFHREPVIPLCVPLSRRDLALHYFPSPTAESSVRRLSRWLHDDPTLLHDLETVGFRPKQRYITRRQLEIFQYYLGA